jgi:type I restriction enzyme, S subunit
VGDNQWKAKGPGVIIGRKGTLGKVYFVDLDYWPHDTTLWVKDTKGNSLYFIYYPHGSRKKAKEYRIEK